MIAAQLVPVVLVRGTGSDFFGVNQAFDRSIIPHKILPGLLIIDCVGTRSANKMRVGAIVVLMLGSSEALRLQPTACTRRAALSSALSTLPLLGIASSARASEATSSGAARYAAQKAARDAADYAE